MNVYIVYAFNSNLNNFVSTLENCLFGAVKWTKNTDIDKNKYSGCSIRSDSRGTFLFLSGKFAQNVITFGVDMSSYAHVDNKKKRYFISWCCSYTRVRW